MYYVRHFNATVENKNILLKNKKKNKKPNKTNDNLQNTI